MESSTMETTTTATAVKEENTTAEGESTQLSPTSEDGSSGCNDPGKMFIGGLSWQTTAEGLRDYFGKFGEVNECMVMRDPATKRARGFGFITFADPASVEKVLAHEQHELDGKKIDPKVAFPKRAQPKMIIKTKKVFIGGLSATSTLEDMRNYFEQYGKVEDAMLMFDKTTQRHRGFGFITFDNDDVSDKVCEIHFHEINGKMVECKKAQPKEVMLPVQLNKSRAAAARNLYGLGPEQLLAYASYLPRLGTYGANMLYPGGPAATLLPNTAASLVTATGNPYSYMFDAQKMDRLAGAARAQQSLQDLSQVFNGFQSYAPLAATSPPGSAAANGAANGGVARGFSVAAAQAAAAQQAVALEAAALYASVGGEPFPAIYPPMHHQSAQMPHAFHKV